VADQHRRRHPVRKGLDPREQLADRRVVEACLDLDPRRRRAEARRDPLERLPGSQRRRAEDEIRSDLLFAQVVGHPLRRPPAARVQRPVVIGEAGIAPVGLGVTQ